MPVPIFKQGDVLIAGIQSSLTDGDLARLKDDLSQQVGQYRARGIIIDVSALDVLDSFASRTLRTISLISRLRGAETVVVGIQPDVAFAMVQMGLTMEELNTALDLEEGLALLAARRPAIGAVQP
jgi:rsbT antagonist protein RsbS